MDGLVSENRAEELVQFILSKDPKITYITANGGIETTDHMYAHCTLLVPSVHPKNFSSHLIVGRRVDSEDDNDHFVTHSNAYNLINHGKSYEDFYKNHARLRDTYLAIEIHNALSHASTPVPTSYESTPLIFAV